MHRGKCLGLSAVLVAVLGLTACSGAASSQAAKTDSTGPVTFAAADPGGSTAKLIAQWNAGHPDEQVSLHQLPADPDAQHADLLQNLAKPDSGYDLVEMKTSDTAEFAAQGWLSPLTGRYAIDTAGLVPAAVAAGSYQNALYGAPLDVDAGLLYYRSDLVQAAPATWAQLSAACATAKRLSIGCYAGQFARGDDLAANTVEAVASAGGQLLQPDGKAVDATSPAVRKGLQFLVDSYRNGVIPKAAITYRSAQSTQAFNSGSLLFMRNWSSAYSTISTSAMKAKFKTAALPGASGPGKPALSGHSLGLNAASQHKRTALDFIKFLESGAVQAGRLKAASLDPVTTASYDDKALRAAFPVLVTLQQSLRQVQVGPVSEYYPGISDAISDSGYAAISGTTSVPAAISQLQQAVSAAAR
ncbi:MAG: extracellular solute-binding protein [Actinomycetota bacterium]|nr:extracellular solute-binding protein [Actinomycetota bacterium]